MDHLAMPLKNDGAITAPSLAEYIDAAVARGAVEQELADLIMVFAQGSIPIAARLAQGHLTGDPTAKIGKNTSGDAQKALDWGAHEHYLTAFETVSVAHVLSEEEEEVLIMDPAALYDVAMDPIDGSGSIGIGAPLGALFGVFPNSGTFLRQGTEMIAAAYVSFGHSLDFGFSFGSGVVIATYDAATEQFYIADEGVTLQPQTSTIAFNASNTRRWPQGLQTYVADLLDGKEGPRTRDFNMRWIAAAVGDLHRILRRGGLFMYPADSRPGYQDGFLRLTYEAFPIAYLIEQAGGRASNGYARILQLTPSENHSRVPLFFGSVNEMDTLESYLNSKI
ncbi:class 1 fructose-bisphosphatase [Loktanella sp. S4079]|uniref:class 1 fructose-bisphosphatase n=1 Tax=Loktanella sp. S4079 TaxID=579483 RepID=UPI0005FA346F|nr:class 1 fructose-bisphosphatase [Loktanella sp. S4079]KJZ18231.1 fructose 1,6-bisphosphatase [Loktanella sp. S4079]